MRASEFVLRSGIIAVFIDKLFIIIEKVLEESLPHAVKKWFPRQFLLAQVEHVAQGFLRQPKILLCFHRSLFSSLPDDLGADHRAGDREKKERDYRPKHRRMPPRPFSQSLHWCCPPRSNRLIFQKTREIVGHLPRRGVALRRRFGQRLEDDRLQLDRYGFLNGAGRPWLVVEDLVQQGLPVVALEGRLLRQQFVKSRAK